MPAVQGLKYFFSFSEKQCRALFGDAALMQRLRDFNASLLLGDVAHICTMLLGGEARGSRWMLP